MWEDQNRLHNIRKSAVRLVAVSFVLAVAAACSPRLVVHGTELDPQKLSEVKPGQMTRREVQEILGSPSSKAVFDKESWYYVSSRTETIAFFEPKIKERKVVIVRFDKKGLVSDVETLNLGDGQDIQMVERITPTKGKEYTLIEQLVGNIGRYTGQLKKGDF